MKQPFPVPWSPPCPPPQLAGVSSSNSTASRLLIVLPGDVGDFRGMMGQGNKGPEVNHLWRQRYWDSPWMLCVCCSPTEGIRLSPLTCLTFQVKARKCPLWRVLPSVSYPDTLQSLSPLYSHNPLFFLSLFTLFYS